MKKSFLILSSLLSIQLLTAQQLASPDGNLLLNFCVNGEGAPVYDLAYKGKAVVKPSTLGFELKREKTDEPVSFDNFNLKVSEKADQKMNLGLRGALYPCHACKRALDVFSQATSDFLRVSLGI